MKSKCIKQVLFGILAMMILVISVCAVIFCRQKMPFFVPGFEENGARIQIQHVMQAICDGDYETAEELMEGNPDLGMSQEPETVVNRLFWEAYRSSLEYELTGELYTSQSGVVQDVKIISLDLSATTDKLAQRAQQLLESAVKQAEDVSEIYDQNNDYKKSFVESVMEQAAREVLEEPLYTYQIVPVRASFSSGQWWVVADKQFLHAISGGVVG